MLVSRGNSNVRRSKFFYDHFRIELHYFKQKLYVRKENVSYSILDSHFSVVHIMEERALICKKFKFLGIIISRIGSFHPIHTYIFTCLFWIGSKCLVCSISFELFLHKLLFLPYF